MEFVFLNGKTDSLADAFEVRQKVFIEEQGYTPELEFDEIDENATHIVGYVNNKPVCTARFFIDDERKDMQHIGRVCVLKENRGNGTGTSLLKQIIAYVEKTGAKGTILGAQVSATGFYEKLGFTQYGEVFYDEEVPHIMMERLL
jgi:Predicted acyltransferase